MNSKTLNPHHRLQLGLIILAFVIVLVASSLIYYYQMIHQTVSSNKQLDNKAHIESVFGASVTLTETEKKSIESAFGN